MISKFILLFLVWSGLTNSLDTQELVLGAVLCLIVSYFFTTDSKIDLGALFVKYVRIAPVFLKDLIVSNIQMAKIVLSPKITIQPAVIKVNTMLNNEFDKLLLANAITLTPGTITIELDMQQLTIHVVDINTNTQEMIEEYIAKYEKILIPSH